MAADRVGRCPVRLRPRRRACLARLTGHVAAADGHGAARRGQLLAGTGRPRLTLAEHQATVAGYQEHGETVDVFLPSCGEPLPVLDNTFRYVSAMNWGGPKTVYALDDSVRDEVRDLAEQYDFRYVVRPNPGEMKKAGNLTHALGISAGDFIAVIDADFAVRPEFLYETMPYFSDPKVGIVQTAQYFDVRNRSFSYIQRYAGTLQEIFFRFIQPARDRYQGRDLRRDEPGLPSFGRGRRGRLRAGADRRGRPLRGEAVVGRIRDPLSAALPGQGRGAHGFPVPGQPAGPLVPFLDDADDREALQGSAV